MPRRQILSYRDVTQEVLTFMSDFLAQATVPSEPFPSNTANKAEAYAFRHAIYRWRLKVLEVLSLPGTPAAREAETWLSQAIGSRAANKDWLDLTVFNVVQSTSGWHVTARIRQPMAGGPPLEMPPAQPR